MASYELVRADGLENPYQRQLVLANKSTETYSLLTIPPESLSLVQGQENLILRNLRMDTLVTQLDVSSDLIYLAYHGVVGQGALAADVSDCQKGLAELCGIVINTLSTLQVQSSDALGYICDAFQSLVTGAEGDAVEMLGFCAENARAMSEACVNVEKEVKDLQTKVRKAVRTVQIQVGEAVAEEKKLRDAKIDLEAEKAAQEAISEDLKKSIADLKQDYLDATAQEDKESERELWAGIVGLFGGVIGTGVGMFTSYETMGAAGPARKKLADESKSDSAAKKNGSETTAPAKTADEGKASGSKAATASKKTTNDTTSESKATSVGKTTVTDVDTGSTAKTIVTDADKSSTTKTTVTDADKGSTAKTSKAKGDVKDGTAKEGGTDDDKSEKKKTEPTKSGKTEQAPLDKKKLAVAIAKGVGRSVKEFQKQADLIVDNARTALDKAKVRRVQILTMKWEEEAENRKALGTVAKLTSLIAYKEKVEAMWITVQASLETARWALDNLSLCLSDAKTFWAQMTDFCQSLSDSDVASRLADRVSGEATQTERVAYYKSDAFVNSGIEYVNAWAALHYVCWHYQQGTRTCREKVQKNVANPPTIAQARGGINDLRALVGAKVEKLRSATDGRINDLAKQITINLEKDLGVKVIQL